MKSKYCNYPECKCPFDMGSDRICLMSKEHKKPKQKKCKVCKTLFTPYSSTTQVCTTYGIECAKAFAVKANERLAKKRHALEKKKTKEALKKFKSKRDYTKYAQIEFNKFIRARDQGKPCICCGKPLPNNVIGGGYDCGHYRSVGSAPHLRFDERNAHGQTKYCNNWLSGNIVNYRMGLIERIGLEEVEALESNQEIKKYTIEDLQEIASHYRKKTKEILSLRGVKCGVHDCDSPADFNKDKVCQKHYFRQMRNGNNDVIKRTRKLRIENPAGYQKIYKPQHKLANSDGYVYEHRMVIYDKYKDSLPDCEVCSNKTLWETCHIDHIDEDVRNNNINNLRPLCRGCNTARTKRTGSKMLEVNGLVMSIMDWSRRDDVSVSHGTIKNRLASGYSNYDAVYTKSKTRPN